MVSPFAAGGTGFDAARGSRPGHQLGTLSSFGEPSRLAIVGSVQHEVRWFLSLSRSVATIWTVRQLLALRSVRPNDNDRYVPGTRGFDDVAGAALAVGRLTVPDGDEQSA